MPRESGTASAGALRSLVGAGPSQVGVVGALRARDVSRPHEDDVRKALAAAPPLARNAPPKHDRGSAGQGTEGTTPVAS